MHYNKTIFHTRCGRWWNYCWIIKWVCVLYASMIESLMSLLFLVCRQSNNLSCTQTFSFEPFIFACFHFDLSWKCTYYSFFPPKLLFPFTFKQMWMISYAKFPLVSISNDKHFDACMHDVYFAWCHVMRDSCIFHESLSNWVYGALSRWHLHRRLLFKK